MHPVQSRACGLQLGQGFHLEAGKPLACLAQPLVPAELVELQNQIHIVVSSLIIQKGQFTMQRTREKLSRSGTYP